ncbi:MAG: alpha/beta fold hydrolase, partial [Acidobacteria bacterium]|nr:alpha/beta fold hydrolase [Acidobacteriota bacterium]
MSRTAKPLYGFGPFLIDTRDGLLLRDGEPVPLTPKAFETLLALVENCGRVLGKEELISRVWPDSFVEENNLSQNISLLRKILQSEGGSKYIETVPKRGYRFTAKVSERWDERDEFVVRERTTTRVIVEEDDEQEEGRPADAAAQFAGLNAEPFRPSAPVGVAPALVKAEPALGFDPSLLRVPETKYARSGDVNIAYQVIGDAPLDLVFVMGWVSHLEYFWTEPSFARFLRRLASFSRLILFDKRGTGLSDRVPVAELPTLEQRMDDVRAVLDAVGSERAALCGVSEGGPMSALFAATYPEKTLALVMIGTYAKRI